MKNAAILLLAMFATYAAGRPLNLMPMPFQYKLGTGRMAVEQSFRITLDGYKEPRLERAAARTMERLSRQTGMPFPATPMIVVTGRPPAGLVIECKGPSKPVQQLGEDESYSLEVAPSGARLSAPNPLGVLRGLETFLQLVEQDSQGFGIPSISIQDQPRFPWRGLMLDVCRHWMPMEVVKRTLDGMAAMKLNVLHWHLSEDQGFRVESKVLPKLHEMGSDGHYFTQVQVREVIDYARDRGIRVVPEFDMPGHATSWLVGYPELGSAPGPYSIERKWGIFDPALDPTKEVVYQFLDKLIAEMAGLFDDEYFHIGGDEVNGEQWRASASIQQYMKQNGLKDLQQLHRVFNNRVYAMVNKNGKRMLGWDEILDPDLPKTITIQSWRGQKALGEAVQLGYSGLLSNGYYLDLMQSTEFHYLNDPINEQTAALTAEQKSRILGGEACMWVEFDTPENIDTRLWPRLAAISERLWSQQDVRDVQDMYRRLDSISKWLEYAGMQHRIAHRMMLERLAGSDPAGPLTVLAEAVEPVKIYTRGTLRSYTQFTPLNRLIDAVYPESESSRNLRFAIARKDWAAVRRTLEEWRDNDARLQPTLATHGLLTELQPLSASLSRVAAIGLQALDKIEGRAPLPADWAAAETLKEAKKPMAELLLMAVPAVESLVMQATAGGAR